MKKSSANNAKKYQWKSFVHMIVKAKVPWYLFAISLAMDLVSATLFVKLPVILGDIMQGAIFDQGQISQYTWLSLAQVVFRFASVTVFNWIYMKITNTSAIGVWNRIIQLPLKALMKEKPSTLTSRVSSDSSGIVLAVSGVFNGLSMLYTVALAAVEMFRMNTTLTLWLMCVPVVLIVCMIIVGNLTYKAQRNMQSKLSAFTSYLAVRLPNMRLIKAFNTQAEEQQLGAERIDAQYGAEIARVKVEALSNAVTIISTTLCNIIVLAAGSYFVAKGTLDAGDLVTFFLFVTQGTFTYNSQTLFLYYTNIKAGMGVSSKLMEIMDMDEEKTVCEKSFTVPEDDIRFNGVSFSYEEKPVLKNVTFTIPKGKTTAIVGSNGSGKTTVLKLLERLYDPDSGTITYGADDIRAYHLNEWRDSIGYVVQNSPIMQGTVADNIAYGMESPDRDAIAEAAKDAAADGFIAKMEQGYDSDVGELGGKLSGGQRQKIAIARALVHHPDMVLLDEAACGLDIASEKEIGETLKKVLAGKTVVTVAHEARTVKDADRIIVLEQGEVVGSGTHDELMNSCGEYRRFCAGNA